MMIDRNSSHRFTLRDLFIVVALAMVLVVFNGNAIRMNRTEQFLPFFIIAGIAGAILFAMADIQSESEKGEWGDWCLIAATTLLTLANGTMYLEKLWISRFIDHLNPISWFGFVAVLQIVASVFVLGIILFRGPGLAQLFLLTMMMFMCGCNVYVMYLIALSA